MTEMTNEQLSALWNLARLDGRKALETIAEEEARTGRPADEVPEIAVCRAFALLDVPNNDEAQRIATSAHQELGGDYSSWFTKSQVTLAWTYLNQGDLAISQSLALEAFRIARDNRDDEATALALSLRGWLNYRKGLDREALEILNLSAQISEHSGQHGELAQRLVEIATTLRRTGKLKEAVAAYQKALDSLRHEQTPFRDLILDGIAYCQASTGSRVTAIRKLLGGADQAVAQNRPRVVAARNFEVAQLLSQPSELTQSIAYGLRAAQVSRDAGLVYTGVNSMQLLVDSLRKNSEYEKAFEMEVELKRFEENVKKQSEMRKLHFTMVRLQGLGRKAA